MSFDFEKQKYKCQFCEKYYQRIDGKCYKNHLEKYHSYIHLINEDFFDESISDEGGHKNEFTTQYLANGKVWLDQLCDGIDEQKFNFLLININSILGPDKFTGVKSLLDLNLIDLLVVVESKLGDDVSDLIFDFSNYNIVRRDRIKGAGGLLIFLKKNYKILSKYIDELFETVSMTIRLKNRNANFLIGYNPHLEFSQNFNDHLEQRLLTMNLNFPTFLVGDFNQDLLCNKGDRLVKVLDNFGLKKFYNDATHFQKNAYSLIDIVCCNEIDFVNSSKIYDCPFSNHRFVLTSCNCSVIRERKGLTVGRKLNDKILDDIKREISKLKLSVLDVFDDLNDYWSALKLFILNIINELAPLKKFKPKKSKSLPWIDKECLHLIAKRDVAHQRACLSGSNRDSSEWKLFREARNRVKSFIKIKKNDYFLNKNSHFFKSSKKFWCFYKQFVKTKKSGSSKIDLIELDDGRKLNCDEDIANEFNKFVSNYAVPTDIPEADSFSFVQRSFNHLKTNGKVNVDSSFKFANVSEADVLILLKELGNSSPGISGIPTIVLSYCADELSIILTKLFNLILLKCQIPDEWKFSLVSPLFKGKGVTTTFDNYRSISVLSPIAKIFEKILCKSIVEYFDSNNLFSPTQHGFRAKHSCESALLTLVNTLKNKIDDKKISLALFIDFKKAFDLINPRLLFLKLFQYGFENSALNLVRDYFVNRLHICKINESSSDSAPSDIGVPQGSVLGPLLFIIFINDLSLNIDLDTLLFADDTTISSSGDNVEDLVSHVKSSLYPFLEWVKMNQLSINWAKTKFMFVTKKKIIDLPSRISIMGNEVEVVDSFKLLGVTIDSSLSFDINLKLIKKTVNMKLFVLKKLSFLSLSVKIQFFKSFIMPHFDYCSALFIFLKKNQVNELEKFFNICLYRLCHFRLSNLNIFDQKSFLESYNILPFKMRVFCKLNIFCYKIMNKCFLPNFFFSSSSILRFKDASFFRNREILYTPFVKKEIEKRSLNYFVPKFVNIIIKHTYNLPLNLYNENFYNNFLNNYSLFINFFAF